MKALDLKFASQLENIKSGIQNSDILKRYLDEEEEDVYAELREKFEPEIMAVHEKVAEHQPLQLVALEEKLFDEGFEGLYLPRILGYSVLRGEINENVKYIRPNDHFKNVLLVVCNSINFDILKQRIGQSIQMGFALSSDIWITSIVKSIVNSKVSLFLESQKLEKFRDDRIRLTGLVKFRKQFESLNYLTTEFPVNLGDLHSYGPALRTFLRYRSDKGYDNSSFSDEMNSFVSNPAFKTEPDFLDLLLNIGHYYNLEGESASAFRSTLNEIRCDEGFDVKFFSALSGILNEKKKLRMDHHKNLSSLIDRSQDDIITHYFNTVEEVVSKGYIHEDASNAVRMFYDNQAGLSLQNECLRNSIFSHFSQFLNNLDETSYADYFEVNKSIVNYMNIFSNQQFNQNVKDISLKYVKKLLKKYIDKRGRDYQDIKKFVKTTFADLGFMKDKELVELFKTRRKKKVVK